jgi:hypothetical protein
MKRIININTRHLLRYHCILFLGLVICPVFSFSQVTIVLRNPNPVPFKSESLLNLNINSSFASDLKVHIEAVISDQQQSPLISFKTEDFILKPGLNDINNLSVISFKYFNAQIKEAIMKSGYLPPSEYNYCIRVYPYERPLAGELCGTIGYIISPPELISPFNTEHVPTKYPQLTWHAPTPLTPEMVTTLNYELKIVELGPEQPAYAAISDNPAIYYNKNIRNEFIQYGANNHELESGKTYVWQVIAYSGETFLGKSEIWVFSVDSLNKDKIKTFSGYYISPKKSFDGVFANFTNVVKFKIETPYELKPSDVRILNSNRQDLTPDSLKIEHHYGASWYSINLTDYPAFKDKSCYFIEITNGDERFIMGFRYLIDKNIYENKNHKEFIKKDY